MIKQLRIKFVCVIMLIVTLMLCTIFGFVMHFTARNLELESISMLQMAAKPPKKPKDEKETTDERRLPVFTVEVGANGEILKTRGELFEQPDIEYWQEIVDMAYTAEGNTGVLKQYNLRYYKEFSPVVFRIVFADTAAEQTTMIHLLYTCLLIGAAALVVFFGISIVLSYWVVKPVETALRQQHQFVADASHELKTPLTIILANAELIQNSADNEEAKKVYADNILATSYKMRSLVENLLKMARADDGRVKIPFAVIDFSSFVRDAVLAFELLYEEKNMQLRCKVADGIKIKGVEADLYQVVDVLLDNALKYSLPESDVDVVLSRHGRYCKLAVAGHGDQLSDEELENIFKRFYRGDTARTMNGSYGLGLSIAETIVTSHRGKIWAESHEGLNVFYVMLPVSTQYTNKRAAE